MRRATATATGAATGAARRITQNIQQGVGRLLPRGGFSLPSFFRLPALVSGNTITVAGIVLLTLALYICIMSVITTVTSSLWLTKSATRPLKDTYDVVLFNDGGNALGIKSYVLAHAENTYTSDTLDDALKNLPAVIMPEIKPSSAEQAVSQIQDLGGVAGVR